MDNTIPIQIVATRLPGDKHDWELIRGRKYRCALCGLEISSESEDTLMFRSGCPQSEVILGT